jgi:hypothetical protein
MMREIMRRRWPGQQFHGVSVRLGRDFGQEIAETSRSAPSELT